MAMLITLIINYAIFCDSRPIRVIINNRRLN